MNNNLFFVGDIEDDVEAAVLLHNLLAVVEQINKQKKGNLDCQGENDTTIQAMSTKSEDAMLLSIQHNINTVPFIVFNERVFLPESINDGESMKDGLMSFILHVLVGVHNG